MPTLTIRILRRYVKMMFKAACINIKHFTARSTRHATSLGSFMQELSIGDIAEKTEIGNLPHLSGNFITSQLQICNRVVI